MLVNKTGFRKKYAFKLTSKRGKWGTFMYVIVNDNILFKDKTAISLH
jgi:hypothetical protein